MPLRLALKARWVWIGSGEGKRGTDLGGTEVCDTVRGVESGDTEGRTVRAIRPPAKAVDQRVTVMVVELDDEPSLAVTVAFVFLFTLLVVTTTVTVRAPAGTVTLEGTGAADELEVSEMDVPPVGAGALSVTVKVTCEPPLTLALDEVMDAMAIAAEPGMGPVGVPPVAATVVVK